MASPFGFFHSIQILKILIVTSFILQLGKSTEVIPAKPVRLRVGMCFPMDDPDRISLNITADLCDCSRHVVNCDFSKFNSTDKTTAELRPFWKEDTVNRICICNAPKNLKVVIAEYFIRGYYNVSRIDICQIDGDLIIEEAFVHYFSGDMYISHVKRFHQMYGWEYGRGGDLGFHSIDPEALRCCSKIKAPKLSSPSFFMEDTFVHTVRSQAIDNEHLWKNVVFNRVTFSNMGTHAMSFHDKSQNASFTHCHFNQMNKTAIAVTDVANFLMAHNTFHSTCHPRAVEARSMEPSSNAVFIQNRFEKKANMEIDANKVAIWFNSFNTWDSETFSQIHDTRHTDRIVSIEFNTVDHFEMGPNDLKMVEDADKIIFNENVIFHCTCELISESQLPELLSKHSQRCFAEVGNHTELCHLKLDEVSPKCTNGSSPDYPQLCNKNENNFRSFTYSKTFAEMAPFLKSVSIEIKSPFINDMLRNAKSPVWMPGDDSLRNRTSSSKHYILFLIPVSIIIILILLFFIYQKFMKNKQNSYLNIQLRDTRG